MRFLCILNKLSMGNFFMSCKIEIFIKFETIYLLKVIFLVLYLVIKLLFVYDFSDFKEI